jgi:hypothetical protein
MELDEKLIRRSERARIIRQLREVTNRADGATMYVRDIIEMLRGTEK